MISMNKKLFAAIASGIAVAGLITSITNPTQAKTNSILLSNNSLLTNTLTNQKISQTQSNQPLDSEEGLEIIKGSNHIYDIESLVMSRNSQIMASGSLYNKIHIWNLQTKKLIRMIDPGKNGATSLAISPDGQHIYAANYMEPGLVRIWNTKTGKLIRRINSHKTGITVLALSPDGKTLMTGSTDTTIKLWNTQTGQLMRTLGGHTKPINAIAFSPDGKIIASAGGMDDKGKDRTIRLWERSTGKLLQTLASPESTGFLAFSPDGKSLISARGKSSDYGKTYVWNLGTKKLIVTIPNSAIFVGFSGDGKRVLSVDGLYGVNVWDGKTGANIRQLVKPVKFEDDRLYGRVYANVAALSSDNKTLVIGDGGAISGYQIGMRNISF